MKEQRHHYFTMSQLQGAGRYTKQERIRFLTEQLNWDKSTPIEIKDDIMGLHYTQTITAN